MTTSAELQALYDERAQSARARADEFAARGRRIGNLRGVTFLTFLVSGGIFLAEGGWIAASVAALGLASFFVLVTRHDRVLAQEEDARRRTLLNEHAQKRVSGAWHDLPTGKPEQPPAQHPYALDLDLFGRGSLVQRLGVAHTRYGQARLASWLLAPASLAEIQARQEAVRELAPELDFRQSFEADGLALGTRTRSGRVELTDGPDPSVLLQWISSGADLPGGSLLHVASYLLPLGTGAGLLGTFQFGLHPALWLGPLLLGLAALTWSRQATSETFAAVSTTEGAFLRYGSMLARLEAWQAQSPWLRQRTGALAPITDEAAASKSRPSQKLSSPKLPSQVMARFRALVGWYDLRHNGMVYPFVNALLLWDIHCTRALLRWRGSARGDIERWFDVIGEVEALSSLAGLLHDEPNASLPSVQEAGVRIQAQRLGHPLIASERRVENDVPPFGPGEALLITGSNMSGKSTFLRALGTNLVLAFAGGPVCAKELSAPLCRIGTSIRVADSLSAGVSHFYAEVQKLRAVVEATKDRQPVLFLLDEILHGTNSRERQIGARWVLAELLSHGAFGIVTTHDMELCRLTPELMEHVDQYHFREDLVRASEGTASPASEEMAFDYKLRPGPVTSGNALRLMRRAGLAVPVPPDESPHPPRST